jgi:ABC-type Mn2+/Zn2+ transport system permease subunit
VAEYPIVEAVLVSCAAALVGVHVVLRRLAFFTMALTHATFPGVVLAALLGVSLYLGGALVGLLAALAVVGLSRRRGHDPSAATAVALACGFAFGVALQSAQNGFTKDLSAYLVGSILTVSGGDLLVAAAVLAGVALVLALGHRPLAYAAFDRVGARAAGFPVAALDLLMLVLIEAVVITALPAVGTILALALIVAPAAAARLWTDRLTTMTAVAVVLGTGSALGGLWLSRTCDIAAGGAISLLAAATFAFSLTVRRLTSSPRPGTTSARRPYHRSSPSPGQP